MLFMTVFNYEPQNRDEIVKRRAEKGGLVPEGMRVNDMPISTHSSNSLYGLSIKLHVN